MTNLAHRKMKLLPVSPQGILLHHIELAYNCGSSNQDLSENNWNRQS